MEVKLKRYPTSNGCTIGNLFINGFHECYTLEDVDRGLSSSMSLVELKMRKIWGKTAIPTGTYKVERMWWEKHNRFVPHILNVPGFEGILIHSGVTANDTLGCPLVADAIINNATQNTTEARMRLDKKIFAALDKGEEVTITIER